MSSLIGANTGATTTTAEFGLGDRHIDHNGKVWVYVQASASIAQYDVVTYDETYYTTVAPVSTSNDARGDKLGVAAVAFANDEYGWLQIYGPCTLNVLGSCNPNVELTTSATGGSLDDATTSSLVVADGIVTTAASVSAAAAQAGILNFPAVGRTL